MYCLFVGGSNARYTIRYFDKLKRTFSMSKYKLPTMKSFVSACISLETNYLYLYGGKDKDKFCWQINLDTFIHELGLFAANDENISKIIQNWIRKESDLRWIEDLSRLVSKSIALL